MHLLLVENHELFAATVVEHFLQGMCVEICGSVSAAKTLLRASEFDAVLVDYDLDDGKGAELVTWLRGWGYAGAVIAVSGREEGDEALLRAGASSVCHKRDFPQIRQHL